MPPISVDVSVLAPVATARRSVYAFASLPPLCASTAALSCCAWVFRAPAIVSTLSDDMAEFSTVASSCVAEASVPMMLTTNLLHSSRNLSPVASPNTAPRLAASASELASRAAVAATASSPRPSPTAPPAAAARYTCSPRSPASRLRSWEAVVSGPRAMVVVVDSATPPEDFLLGLPQAAPRTPTVKTVATNRRSRRCSRIIVFPFTSVVG
jgi:hypothetical protein